MPQLEHLRWRAWQWDVDVSLRYHRLAEMDRWFAHLPEQLRMGPASKEAGPAPYRRDGPTEGRATPAD